MPRYLKKDQRKPIEVIVGSRRGLQRSILRRMQTGIVDTVRYVPIYEWVLTKIWVERPVDVNPERTINENPEAGND